MIADLVLVVLGRAGVWAGLLMVLVGAGHVDEGTSGPWALIVSAVLVSVTGAWVARDADRRVVARAKTAGGAR